MAVAHNALQHGRIQQTELVLTLELCNEVFYAAVEMFFQDER